jgi:hypothetical protein
VTNRLARWDGVAWSEFGGGVNNIVYSLAVLDTGDLVAAGTFTNAGGVAAPNVARWNGTTWSAMTTGVTGPTVRLDVLRPLPGGQFLLAGLFTGIHGMPATNLARWNGQGWSTPPGPDGWVRSVAPRADGRLVFGGEWKHVGGAVSPYFAELVPPCSATSVLAGAGCVGSGGPNVLTVESLPWLGGTCRTRATGMPANGLAVASVGFAPAAIYLPAVLAQGVVGCTQWSTLELLELLVPTAGSVVTNLAIPNQPALVGASFYRQVAGLEFDAFGAFVAITTTNALQLTIGTY